MIKLLLYDAALGCFQMSKPFFLGDFASRDPIEHSYSSATVLLKEGLDYEGTNVYLVPVRVRDTATCPESSCDVSILPPPGAPYSFLV